MHHPPEAEPNAKLSHPDRVCELQVNDQLPSAGGTTLAAERLRVDCSALFGSHRFLPLKETFANGVLNTPKTRRPRNLNSPESRYLPASPSDCSPNLN